MIKLKLFTQLIKEWRIKFEKNWEAKNLIDPENYPLELPQENCGLWLEFFEEFIQEKFKDFIDSINNIKK